MSMPSGLGGPPARARSGVWLVGAVLALALLWLLVNAAPSSAANAISTENALPGDPHSYRPITPESSLDVYASQISITPGETLQLHVSAAPGTRYEVLIYRLGWYQGNGARLIGCLPACGGDRAGAQYPVPAPDPNTGFLDAGWPVTDSFQVPTTAVTGYYLAEAVATSGPNAGRMRYSPFIVRAPSGQTPSHILVQIGVNTAEAYNQWGGKSLYAYNSTGEKPAVKVSFNRPFDFQSRGSAAALDGYQLIRFLERAGYDVSYTTDVDTDANPGELRRHRLVIVDGHDEYWTKGIYDAFYAARDAGVNLASFGGDIAGWQNRYEDGDRTIVEYRSASADPETDPALKTVEFQKLATPRPTCELFGVEYRGGFNKYIPNHLAQSYTVTQAAAANAWFAGTGLLPGTVLPSLVGYEWDTIMPGCNVPPLTDLFHWAGFVNADSTLYTAPSGARVFATGSLDFATGLDEWPAHGAGVENSGLQRFALNLLTDLGGGPPATAEQLFPAPQSPQPVAPVKPAPVPQQITALHISPARFRAAGRGAAVARRAPPVGAGVTYTDTSKGATTFTLSRYVHVRCRHVSRGRARICLRRALLARFVRQDNAGANGFRLTGRLRGHRLAPGSYLLSATPQAGLGAHGARTAGFQILR
jgi:hypothetical protein